MKLSYDLQQKLKKQFEANAFIEMQYKGLDIAFKTDSDGNAVTLFVGQKTGERKIKGQRYVRTYQKDVTGKILKDHWDLKGKVS